MIFGRALGNFLRENCRRTTPFFRRTIHGNVGRIGIGFGRRVLIGGGAAVGTGTVFGLGLWGKVTEDPDAAFKKKVDGIAERADAMYDNRMLDGLYDYLKEQCTGPAGAADSAELLWRFARASYEKAKKSTSPQERQRFTVEAFDQVKRALELNDKLFAVHKWYAILLEAKSGYEGTKAKIKESFKIKEHLQKALDLNPRDATTWHILGVWYFTIAGLKWYERTLASTFFATPPTATYQEALDCFLKAESISPNFYSPNLLYLAKTYKEMGDLQTAKRYLRMVVQYVVVTTDDAAALTDAEKLLKETIA